ncbi:MAG: carbohydrate binding family 9 domain-containing protein, partial [Candidatus Aminicenantaceae bacterium]
MKKPLAIKINESIEIDGLLNEPGWKKAVDANELMQFKPEKGNPDYVETTIKILYDDNFIYFGFLCYDPQPDKIEAQVKERDKDLRNDDSVYILIDSLFDRDNFYYFGTNLLGAQFDGRLSLDGQRADVKWDGVWKSASQKTDFGWSIEIAIDLSSLKYEPKKEKTMDLTLSRIVARMPRNIVWEGPLDPAFKVSYLGQLKRLVL